MEGVFFTHLTLNYELPDINREFITVPYTSIRLFNLNPEIKRLNKLCLVEMQARNK